MIGVADVEETASAGVSQGATGARKTGLWTIGVVAPRRPGDARPPDEVDETECIGIKCTLCLGTRRRHSVLGGQWREWLKLEGLQLFTGWRELQVAAVPTQVAPQVSEVKPAGDEPSCIWLVELRVAEGGAA